ncbi:MAG: SurA N-terminal domain-containing protein [Deltaproteobacteria bacterium]|nr:SurA N-terminal domain-containing protein [Deltaproteobacteria bacterium]
MNIAQRRKKGPLYDCGRAPAVLGGVLCLLFVLSGCSAPDESPRADVATVNGEKIYLRDFKKKMERAVKLSGGSAVLEQAEITRLKEEVLNGLINEKVMLGRARELSLSVRDEELMQKIRQIKKDYSGGSFNEILAAEKIDYRAWREELRNSLLLEKLIDADVNNRVSVTEKEGKAYFHAHRKEYAAEKRVHVAQIIVRDGKKADDIRRRLKKGENFGKVAREVSIGPEASLGGDLGFFSRGVMPEVIDKTVFSLSAGEISRVVKSPFGYHIFKLLARDEGGRKSFPEVKEKILADIKKRKEEKAYTEWLAGLRTRAVVRRKDDLLKKISVPGAHGKSTSP